MNTRMNHLNPLCAALRGAHLARAGAMLALALGAAQAGAVTYTVPLQFNITLVAPVCSLTVGGTATVDATTANGVHPTGHTVDLTPTAVSAIATPAGILSSLYGTAPVTVSGPGISFASGQVNVRLEAANTPEAWATCTAGTPMTARVTAGSTLSNTNPGAGYMAGTPGGSQTPASLPIGMLMGISAFAGVTGASGSMTWSGGQPSVAATASGVPQALGLTAMLYTNPAATALSAAYAGLWTYKFNVNLDF